MKREEAIEILKNPPMAFNEKMFEAIDMAIEALKQPSNETQLLDDGTLKVKVADVLDIKRVMVMDNNIIYDAYYPDRPRGEWIDNGDNWLCSNCNVESYVDEDYRPEDKRAMQMNYCHYCGAIMVKGGGTE